MDWIGRIKRILHADDSSARPPGQQDVREVIPGVLRVLVTDQPLQLDPAQVALDAVATPAFRLPSRCRAYVTDGFAKLGCKEIAFVLAHEGDAADPAWEEAVLAIMRTLHGLSREGRPARAGDLTVFGDAAPFGIPRCGLAYVDAFDGPGPVLARDGLLAMYLHPEECVIAGTAGIHRVLAWLAHAYRLYPNPVFSEPGRASTVPLGEMTSRLADVPRVPGLRGAELFVRDRVLTLRLPADAVQALDGWLTANEEHRFVCALGGRVHGADARFVWLPAQQGLQVVGAIGSTLSMVEAGFVMLAGGQEANDYRASEDGFLVMTTGADWHRVRRAIATGADTDIAFDGASNGLLTRFRIEFRKPVPA